MEGFIIAIALILFPLQNKHVRHIGELQSQSLQFFVLLTSFLLNSQLLFAMSMPELFVLNAFDI